MELVAYGAQDIYLTGNPQITFFKVVYRRHTNFSMESIEQTWQGIEIGSSATDSVKCESIISRNGDLLSRMYLELTVDNDTNVDLADVSNNVTSGLIDTVELQIGGQRIDIQSGAWMETWAELTEPNPDGIVSDYNTNSGTLFQKMSGFGGCVINGEFIIFKTGLNPKFFVPLSFWFCRNNGLALPLIALQYHEIKVILNHRFNNQAAAAFGHLFSSNKLWCDYIYLDTDERRRFAQVSHEYLIEQVQEKSFPQKTINVESLNFNHPVKELIFINMEDISKNLSKIASGTSTPTLKLVFNGSDRFKERDYRYFTRTQVYQHHTGAGLDLASFTPEQIDRPEENSRNPMVGHIADTIGVYSFALKPEEHQPSGTCNFSRIDSAHFIATSNLQLTHIFAVNYNVLRIMSGMGGLAYSN